MTGRSFCWNSAEIKEASGDNTWYKIVSGVIANVVAGIIYARWGWCYAQEIREPVGRTYSSPCVCVRSHIRMCRTSGRQLPSPFPDTMHHWTPIKFACRRRNSRRPEKGRNSRRVKQKGREVHPSNEGTENATRKFHPTLNPPVEFPPRPGLWIISVDFTSAICITESSLTRAM